jgi:hypothetical protein
MALSAKKPMAQRIKQGSQSGAILGSEVSGLGRFDDEIEEE